MPGVITRIDVLCNARVVIAGFGWRCFLMALVTRRPFLICCCALAPEVRR